MSGQIITQACSALVDLIWEQGKPELVIDQSVRDLISKNLYGLVLKQIGATSSIHDALGNLRVALSTDEDFTFSVYTINKNIIIDYKEFLDKYGGKNALFALAILLSIKSDDNQLISDAKQSMFNWYIQDAHIAWLRLNGGFAHAAWPFEWFMENFDSIAVSVVSNGLVEIVKVKPILRAAINLIKQSFKPYPESMKNLIIENESPEEFHNRMEKTGMFKQFLLLLQLDSKSLDMIIDDWTNVLQMLISSIPSVDKDIFIELLQGTKIVKVDELPKYNSLTEQKLVKIIECGLNDFRLVLMPDVILSNM
jgi:hypothetical protein